MYGNGTANGHGTATSDEADLVRMYLADRTIGCPVCRYNLRGAAGDSCPECGTKLTLHLNTLDARLGPWLLGVISIAMALGFSFILGSTAAFGALRAWRMASTSTTYSRLWSEFDSYTLAGLAGLTLFYSLTLLFIIRRRAKFLRKSRFEQWLRTLTMMFTMAGIQVAALYAWSHWGSGY